jgi:hypothetical protein
MTVVTVERGRQSSRESARKRALPAPTPAPLLLLPGGCILRFAFEGTL